MSKVIIVTGASSGIGKSTALQLIKEGNIVYGVARRLEKMNDIIAAGGKALAMDVTNHQQVKNVVQQIVSVEQRIDVLVNNAGVADFGNIEETNFKRWNEVMKTNLNGVFLCSQKVIIHLKKTKGNIINIASISGLRASTLRVAYGTSKAAVIQLTKQQAAELGEYGIRVNCIAPGPVKTKLAMAVHTQDIIEAYHYAIPLNRYGTEKEIANGIYFLASEKASYITGQVLAVDGGFEATGVGLPSLRK